MTLDELQTLWEQDCQIDELRLGEMALEIPKLHAKYLRELVNVKMTYSRVKSEYNIMRKNKFRYYRGELSREELKFLNWSPYQGLKPLKSEMDEILQGDSELSSLDLKVDYLQIKIYFLESVMNSLKNRSFDIKNSITWRQFLAGN